MPTPILTIAKVTRNADTVTLRAKLSDVAPASVQARVVDGQLIVTAHRDADTAGVTTSVERHRLIDLGPKLRPTTVEPVVTTNAPLV